MRQDIADGCSNSGAQKSRPRKKMKRLFGVKQRPSNTRRTGDRSCQLRTWVSAVELDAPMLSASKENL
jgi:hypothetical protein